MNKRQILLFSLSFLGLISLIIYPLTTQAFAGDDKLVVIANKNFPMESLNIYELRRIFLRKMGRISGVVLLPCNQSHKSQARKEFRKKIMRMSKNRLKRLWLKNRLAGLLYPPLVANNIKSLLNYVSKNKGGISYIYANQWEKLSSKNKQKTKIITIAGLNPHNS